MRYKLFLLKFSEFDGIKKIQNVITFYSSLTSEIQKKSDVELKKKANLIYFLYNKMKNFL
jgi:hypothetical protein